MSAYIYGLCDPRDGQLRYVGKANNWRQRSYEHVCASLLVARTHKNNWIRNLLEAGHKPDAFVIEEVPAERWQDAEREWIAYFRFIGADLTNATAGGDGLNCPSEDTRKSIGDACRGINRTFSPEHKAKIAAANRARAADPAWRTRMARLMRGNKNALGVKKPESHRAALSAIRKAEFAAKSPEQKRAFAMLGVAARRSQ